MQPKRKVAWRERASKLDIQSDLDEILHVAQMLPIFMLKQEIISKVISLN